MRPYASRRSTIYHPVGTRQMGHGPQAVVEIRN